MYSLFSKYIGLLQRDEYIEGFVAPFAHPSRFFWVNYPLYKLLSLTRYSKWLSRYIHLRTYYLATYMRVMGYLNSLKK